MKTIEEINQKITKGEAVVVNAQDIIRLADEDGLSRTAREVDVVTTATFGPMCSSGAFLNFGHTKPKIRASQVWFNNVPAYGSIAAVDAYLGATALPENDPTNSEYPGAFSYGGGHIIEELIAGKEVRLEAKSYGTDCYPRKSFEKTITIDDLRNATLTCPRNCYQNYNVAVNATDKTVYTYMGKLNPKFGNIHYSTTGQLSPLINDPYYKTIGIGTRIWLAGDQGYVYYHGTQHDPNAARTPNGVPKEGSGTLSVVGDMKKMDSRYIRGVSLTGYGVSLSVGIGIPIPILNEDILKSTTVSDNDIKGQVIDYGYDYPNAIANTIAEVSYGELRSGSVEIYGQKIPTAPLSSYPLSLEIAEQLGNEIRQGKFQLSKAVQTLPGPEVIK